MATQRIALVGTGGRALSFVEPVFAQYRAHNELVAFLDAVRTGNAPAVTGDEGVASLEIAIKCLEAPAGAIAAPLRKGPRAVAS